MFDMILTELNRAIRQPQQIGYTQLNTPLPISQSINE